MAPRRKQTSSLPAAKLNGDAARDSERLQILLEDYSQGRDDERNWNTVLASLIAVAFTLIGLLIAAVTQTCRFSTSSSCTQVPDYLIAATPILPIALLMFTQILGTVATFRIFYLRAVETEIQQYAGAPLKSISPILPASYMDMTTELTSLRRGRLQYRIVTFLLVATIIFIFGGFACYVAWHMDPTTQVVMAVIYAPIVLLMVNENWTAGPGGRSMFYKMARRYIAHRNMTGYALPDLAIQSSHVKQDKRSLPSYLLMPRVAEWVKWVITPGAFVVTAWATGAFRNWHQFILVWAILEYLIYEARYQWNDIRGIDEDAYHPESTARLRLPRGPNARRNIVASCLVGILRLILAVSIAAVTHLLAPVTLLIGLVFSAAILYEALRAAPASPDLSPPASARSVAIWITVGLGYAIRSGTGMWLGGVRLLSLTAISGMLYFLALGIMFVLLTWVLEAASYCTSDRKEFLFRAPVLKVKPHIATLLRWTGWTVQYGTGGVPGATVPVLKEKQGKRRAPWNVALLLGAGLGAVVGTGLARSNPALTAYGPVVAASLLGALWLMIVSRFATRLAVTAAVAVALVGLTLPSVHHALAIIAAIPWIAIAACYAFFRNSSYQALMNFGPDLLSALKTAVYTLALLALRLVVGRQTWQSTGFGPALLEDDRDEISIDVYIDTDNERTAARIFSAVDELAALVGARDINLEKIRRGSFFRRSKAKLATIAGEESVLQRLKTLERLLELWQLDSRQADVDQKSSGALSTLVEALDNVPRASIRIGSILLVKYQDNSGPVLLSRQLSQPEIWAFEKYPELQNRPENIISALALVLSNEQESASSAPE